MSWQVLPCSVSNGSADSTEFSGLMAVGLGMLVIPSPFI